MNTIVRFGGRGGGKVDERDRRLAVLLLEKAAQVIRRGWTQHAQARRADGGSCGATHPDAVSWCMLGARDRAMFELGLEHVLGDKLGRMGNLRINPVKAIASRAVRETLEAQGHHGSQVGFNDVYAQSGEDVASMYRAAAQRLLADA